MSKLDLIANSDPENKTNAVQEAEEQLRNYGLNVDEIVQQYLTGEPIPEESLRDFQFNWINDAIVLPQSGSRPLIYQDPRFALFTQFQGFIATFTANQLPKLWGEYVKRGSPAMKYNAFATMATMILLGFVSQYLKDMIKYEPWDDEKYDVGYWQASVPIHSLSTSSVACVPLVCLVLVSVSLISSSLSMRLVLVMQGNGCSTKRLASRPPWASLREQSEALVHWFKVMLVQQLSVLSKLHPLVSSLH